MHRLGNIWQVLRRQPRWRFLVVLGALGLLGWLVWGGGGRSEAKVPLFSARRGPLQISVLEGGSLQALESQEIKCEVRVGYQGTKILKIVEEGYLVTDEDLRTNKVLVELDSSDLQKQLVQQEIQFQSAVASLIDAEQNYEIQLSQNLSDVKAAEQKARFARLDFDKFLGDGVTSEIIEQVGLDKVLATAATNNVEDVSQALAAGEAKPAGPATPAPPPGSAPVAVGTNAAPTVAAAGTNAAPAPAVDPKFVAAASAELVVSGPLPAAPAAPPQPAKETTPAATEEPAPVAMSNSVAVDFSPYANAERLGDGEAKQKIRKFEDDLLVAKKELGQAESTVEGTRRLFDKGFVTKTEVQRDEIAYDNSRLKVQTAGSARDLFLKYDFLKSAEEALSKYAEAVRELDKARRVAISKLAQAKAKLKSAQGQHQVQTRQLNDLKEQLDKCVIKATKPGLVVYGAAGEEMFFYGGEERIREGATVRERQAIITIPDLKRMAVKVKVHESYIKKVKKGQHARVTVDAFPDKMLTGEVTKVGVLPDSQNRWMNPDLKVYLTTITVEGTHDWVKPGMSAKVEILVNKIEDCVYVPVQAVSPDGGKQVCYVSRGLTPSRREVEVGELNDEFIEIKSGLREGEQVLLRPPGGLAPAQASPEPKPADKEKTPAATPPATPAAVPVTASKG